MNDLERERDGMIEKERNKNKQETKKEEKKKKGYMLLLSSPKCRTVSLTALEVVANNNNNKSCYYFCLARTGTKYISVRVMERRRVTGCVLTGLLCTQKK